MERSLSAGARVVRRVTQNDEIDSETMTLPREVPVGHKVEGRTSSALLASGDVKWALPDPLRFRCSRAIDPDQPPKAE